MTAVAPPLTFQQLSRTTWGSENNSQGGLDSMSAGEVSRMLMPRKSANRTNSSSSLASSSYSASSTSALSAQSLQSNGGPQSTTEDLGGWGAKRKPNRGLWPPSKSEATTGVTNRSHVVGGQTLGGHNGGLSQASAILPSSHMMQSQQNGIQRSVQQPHVEGTPVLYLTPLNNTFERKTITVPWAPEVLRIGRQTNAKTIPTPINGFFDSKVLSRQHAEIWADRYGKIFIRDVKSSNGTFVNRNRLSAENKGSDPCELREQDILELGIDIVSEDQKTVVHHKVEARVEHAGVLNNSSDLMNLNFGDIDPTAGGGVMGSSLGQISQTRNRTSSHGSVNSNGRGQSVGGSDMNRIGGQRQLNFWLTPVTMEQIVKRLTTELNDAKQQSMDIQRTGEFFDSLKLGHPANKPVDDHSHSLQVNGIMSKSDPNTRFLNPPAPPPQQPLPEKPDTANSKLSDAPTQPPLRRVDTARPLGSTSSPPPAKESSSQIVSLVEALTLARKEITSQSAKVRDLENMLQQERIARETAEKRLEAQLKESSSPETTLTSQDRDQTAGQIRGLFSSVVSTENGKDDSSSRALELDGDSSEDEKFTNDSTTRLQRKLDIMVAEMDEMKQVMEKYKRRVEDAEDETSASRRSLAEMVEKIRKDDAAREAKLQARESKDGIPTPRSNGGLLSFDTKSSPSSNEMLRQAGVENGKPLGPGEVAALERVMSTVLAQSRNRHDQLAQSAPYASILGVMCVGMGLMVFLNGWQKVEK